MNLVRELAVLITFAFMFIVSGCSSTGTPSTYENINFIMMPPNATIDDAISSVNAAAIKRGWTVHEMKNNKLRIELNHRGYEAVLDFSFFENEILYSDFTTSSQNNIKLKTYGPAHHSDFTTSSQNNTKLKTYAPDNWVTNLRKDTSGFLALNKGRTPVKELYSYEDMEKKLEGLKALYDKKLITETQYQLKQKEIMSRY